MTSAKLFVLVLLIGAVAVYGQDAGDAGSGGSGSSGGGGSSGDASNPISGSDPDDLADKAQHFWASNQYNNQFISRTGFIPNGQLFSANGGEDASVGQAAPFKARAAAPYASPPQPARAPSAMPAALRPQNNNNNRQQQQHGSQQQQRPSYGYNALAPANGYERPPAHAAPYAPPQPARPSSAMAPWAHAAPYSGRNDEYSTANRFIKGTPRNNNYGRAAPHAAGPSAAALLAAAAAAHAPPRARAPQAMAAAPYGGGNNRQSRPGNGQHGSTQRPPHGGGGGGNYGHNDYNSQYKPMQAAPARQAFHPQRNNNPYQTW